MLRYEFPMSQSEYTRVVDVELLEGIRIHRSGSEQPSLTVSSSGSICLNVDRKRHDRRKERINTELLTAVFRSDVPQVKRLLELGASPDATCRTSWISVCHISALKGDEEIFSALLQAGADFTARDQNGTQPVHLASWEGNLNILSVLLKHYGSELANSPILAEDQQSHEIECLDSWSHNHEELIRLVPDDVCESSTPLHLACKRAHVNCVELLIDKGANVHAEDYNGLTPLDVSGLCHDGDPKASKKKNIPRSIMGESGSLTPVHKVVTLLIERGASMPKGNLMNNRSSLNSKKITTLHTAVSKCELDLIKYLLENGASLTTLNDKGETPIHLAIRKWSLESLKTLVTWEPKMVDVRDSDGRTPLHLAVLQEWSNGVEILLEAGADVTATANNRETVLHLAAQLGNSFLLEELLSMPDSSKVLEFRNSSMHTPVFRAVICDHLSCVEILSQHGADLTVSIQGNFTLLHCATSNNCPEIVEFLLQDPKLARQLKDVRLQEEKGGMTALHIAAKKGCNKCIELLLNGKSDVNAKTTEGEKLATPLHLAAKYGHREAVEILIDNDRSTIKSVNKDGWQPLHVAASYGHGNCVKLMLEKGADISETVHDGCSKRTALDIILYCVPQPIDFIEGILDSNIQVNEHYLSDPECKVTLKYDVLVPTEESCKQLRVLNAILNSGKRTLQERFLLHPLVEIFLYLKWRRLRVFFNAIMSIHIILTISLTVLAHLEYVEKNAGPMCSVLVEVARGIMYTSLIPIVFIEIVNTSQLERYYFLDYESWVKWAVICLTLFVGMIDPRLVWARYATSVAVLLAWIELLFLLAHFPSWGFYVLMFSRVASKIFKVLGTFTFLVLGFTFSFLILFEANIPFRNFLESLIKVLVMMLEFDYENTFETAQEVTAFSITGRIMFATFVILVAMVMMNLMVGLAVNDIAKLAAQGKTQRLAKQTAFLSFLERFVYNAKLKKILPSALYNVLKIRGTVPEITVIKPAQPMHSEDFALPRALRDAVLDRLWPKTGPIAEGIDFLDSKIDRLADVVKRNISTVSIPSLTTEKTITQDTKIILEQILNDQRKLIKQVELLTNKNSHLLENTQEKTL